MLRIIGTIPIDSIHASVLSTTTRSQRVATPTVTR